MKSQKHFHSLILLLLLLGACTKNPCENSACVNGGICVDGNCDCPPGFSGPKCETEDPCRLVDCGPHGDCVNGICECDDEYEGAGCNTPKQNRFLGNFHCSGSCDYMGPANFDVEVSAYNDLTHIQLSGLFGLATIVYGNLNADYSGFTIPTKSIYENGNILKAIGGSGTFSLTGSTISSEFTLEYVSGGCYLRRECTNVVWTRQ